MKSPFLIFILLISISLSGCSKEIINKQNNVFSDINVIDEVEILEIPLKGEISHRNSELSGLSWYGSKLILLPQFPDRFDKNIGKIFYIEKMVLEKYILGLDSSSITPKFFTIDLKNFQHLFGIGSGFEALTVRSDTAYFTIEYFNNGQTESILISGIIDTLNSEIILNKNSMVKDPNNLFIYNISDESILNYGNQIIPIYEVFGKNINSDPKVSVFDLNLNYQSDLTFPNLEYRITDVTSVDDSGYFWAINYFYPEDNKKLKPAPDSIIIMHGIGKSHRDSNPIERLVKLKINDNNISIAPHPPIYLKLEPDESRNWEGLVRYGDKGFIITSDTFPRTILAFIKFRS
jgi:hypothetical protein